MLLLGRNGTGTCRIDVTKDDHPVWIFILKEFLERYHCPSHLLCMRPTPNLQIDVWIRDVEFFEELLTADYTEPKYKRIMFYIRMYICYKAVAEGIGELHKLPTEKGLIFEHSSADGVEQSVVTNRQLTQTKEYCDSKAENYLDGAISIMLMCHEDYPNFIGFVGNSPSDGVFHRNNTNKKTFFA